VLPIVKFVVAPVSCKTLLVPLELAPFWKDITVLSAVAL